MRNLDRIRVNTENHLVSSCDITERIVPCCRPRSVKSGIKMDAKRILIEILIPLPTLAMLIVRITVSLFLFPSLPSYPVSCHATLCPFAAAGAPSLLAHILSAGLKRAQCK